MTHIASATPRRRRAKILLLADNSPRHAATVVDHIHALRRLTRHDVDLFNPVGAGGLRLPLQIYDAVVIHHSVIIIEPYFLSPVLYEQVAAYDGLKVQFIQDEYRWVNDITAGMRELGIHVVFTCAEAPEAQLLYGELPGITIVPTLTGYLPARLRNVKTVKLADRTLDVGYRGRQVPYWLGELAQDKVRIATRFEALAREHNLAHDIDYREERRVYGRNWDRFLGSCRCILGTESGASIADWDRSVEQHTAEYLAEHPGASFEEVSAAVLAPHEGNLRISVISPRVFEATAHGAALIQFPGPYSGIVEPWEHYIPLEKDFSNADEVVDRMRDVSFLEELTSRARRALVESGAYGYDVLAREFDAQLDAAAAARLALPPRAARAQAAAVRGRWLMMRATRASYLWLLKRRVVRRTLTLQPAETMFRHMRGSRAWSALRLLVFAFVVLRATARSRVLRRVVVASLRTRSARETLAPGRGGLGDLLRLAVLVETARRPSAAGFRTTPRLDADQTLTLVSHRLDDPKDEPTASVSAASVRELRWNHSGVGRLASCPVFWSRRISFTPGGPTNPFVRDFALVRTLIETAPAVACAVVASLVTS